METPKITLSQFFRYAYAGLLPLFIGATICPAFIKTTIDALGPVLTPFVAIALGCLAYVLYRFIVGNFIDFIHLIVHTESHCAFKYIAKTCEVKKYYAIIGFRVVRDDKFKQIVQDILEIRHAEIHVAYLTFTVCATTIALDYYFRNYGIAPSKVNFLILLGIVSIGAGFVADLWLCREERVRIKNEYDKDPLGVKKLVQESSST